MSDLRRRGRAAGDFADCRSNVSRRSIASKSSGASATRAASSSRSRSTSPHRDASQADRRWTSAGVASPARRCFRAALVEPIRPHRPVESRAPDGPIVGLAPQALVDQFFRFVVGGRPDREVRASQPDSVVLGSQPADLVEVFAEGVRRRDIPAQLHAESSQVDGLLGRPVTPGIPGVRRGGLGGARGEQSRRPQSRSIAGGPLVSLAGGGFVYIRNERDGSEQLFGERDDPRELTNQIHADLLQSVVRRFRARLCQMRPGSARAAR